MADGTDVNYELAGRRAPAVTSAMADDRLRQMFDQETGATLRIALLVIGVSSVGYVPAYLGVGGTAKPLLALVAGASGAAMLLAWLWSRRTPLNARYNHAAFAALILVSSANAAYAQAAVQESAWTTQMTIIIIGAGMCIVGWRWSLATAVGSIVLWALMTGPRPAETGWGHSAAGVGFALLAAGIINTGRRRSIVRLLQVTEEAERAAVVDSLTQVYNRRGLALVASHLVRTAKRTGEPVGVLVLDIDRFKRINDQHGHQAGDQVLVAVAAALRSGGRDNDVVARWGGDEFVVVTLGNAPEADELAKRVEQLLLADAVLAGADRIEVSVGVANIQSIEDPDDIDRLISEADAAMYAGRARRRDRHLRAVPIDLR